MPTLGVSLFDGVLSAAITGAVLGGIFAASKQFTKHREAKHFKDNIDDLQKRITELPKDASKEQFDQVLKDWETRKK